jgi:hypothetical protein
LLFIYQNGSLLRKYTYLSNDSSYSISIEDGVDIVVPNNLSSGDESLDSMNETSGSSLYSQSESTGTQSFTFETQVICFIFPRKIFTKLLTPVTYAQDLTCLLVFTVMLLGSLCMFMHCWSKLLHRIFAVSGCQNHVPAIFSQVVLFSGCSCPSFFKFHFVHPELSCFHLNLSESHNSYFFSLCANW